jgi:hypothetical protein
MNKSSTILKPYLRKFILQIHPDFFHHDKLKKETNAASLQKLYNVLQPPTQQNTATPIKLEFFTKQQKKKKEKAKAIVEFDSHDSEWNRTSTFFTLCKQLDIPILQSDLDIVHDMIAKENKPVRQQQPHKSLTKEFAERLYKQRANVTNTAKEEWKPNDILNHRLVVFDPAVKNKKIFAVNLSAWLPQLQPERWWGKIPIMVISPESELPLKELTKGILLLKSDMTLEGKTDISDFVCYCAYRKRLTLVFMYN